MNYLDFDLQIEASGDGNHYRARVLTSPVGQAECHFTLPFDEKDLRIFVLSVGRTRSGVRSLNSPQMRQAIEFGSELYRAVFQDQVKGCLLRSLNEADKQGAGLRLRLRLDGRLINLPWEFLYDTTHRRFFSYSNRTPIVRFLDVPQRIPVLSVALPLKVLVMIASPSDYGTLDVEQEWQKVKDAVKTLEGRGLLQLTRLENGTLAALRHRLLSEQFHVFHYIGHGSYDDENEEGVLLLEDENGRGRRVSGTHLGTLLHEHTALRLVLLNACEGARSAVTDLFAGVAQHLVLQGLPAVIAMQFEITDHAAITLVQAFYEALGTGSSVDASLTEARKAIFAEGNDVEWATPVLYMRATDGRLFDLPKLLPKPELEKRRLFDLPTFLTKPEKEKQRVEESQPILTPKPNIQNSHPISPMTNSYLDFDLAIGRNNNGSYSVQARWQGNEAYHEATLPSDSDPTRLRREIEEAVLDSPLRRRRAFSSNEETVRYWGQRLFDFALSGEVLAQLRACQRAAKSQSHAGVRLRLRILDPELAGLPWEYLYDSRLRDFIVLDPTLPIVRYLHHPQAVPPLQISLPLRILAMVASPINLPTLDVEAEKHRVEQAVRALQAEGRVELVWLPGDGALDLQAALRKGPWHIFHFVGHGDFDAQRDEGYLVLCNPRNKQAETLYATQLARLLAAQSNNLRFVLLNACESARGSSSDIFSSTAETLINRDIPAVLAMQYSITDDAATIFAQNLYQALADGLPIDRSVAEARNALAIADSRNLEWGVPVLHMRSPDGLLFDWGERRQK